MSRERFTFHDIDLIENRIRRLSEDAAYLVLQDRTTKDSDDRVGRFDLIEASAWPWKKEPIEAVEPSGEQAEREEDGEGDTEEEEADDIEAELTWPQVKEAACRWLRDTALRHAAGQSPRRFRMKVLGPKGSSLLDSGHFGCTDRHWRPRVVEVAPAPSDAPPQGPPPHPALPNPADAGALPAGDAIGALAIYYTQFGQLVLGTFGQLQAINLGNVTRLSQDLDRSRDQVEELVASILNHRASEVEQLHRHAVDQQRTDATTVIARDFVSHVGEATRQWLGTKALPPQLAGLAPLFARNPELLQALAEPNVQAMLSDPSATHTLLPMLRSFAAQHTPPAQLSPPAEAPQG